MFAAHPPSRRYNFDRSEMVLSNAANFIGFQVRLSVVDLSLGCVVCGCGGWCVVCGGGCVVWGVVCGVRFVVLNSGSELLQARVQNV